MIVLCVVLGPVHEVTASIAFGFAASWQMTPMKHSALQRCHRTMALQASGWRADRDCVVFGLQTAGHCVTSCWAAMFACALVSHSLAALAFVQAIAMHERAAHAPQQVRYAFLLAGFAAFLALPKAGAL
jgi:predicted metal-binding membrane protein